MESDELSSHSRINDALCCAATTAATANGSDRTTTPNGPGSGMAAVMTAGTERSEVGESVGKCRSVLRPRPQVLTGTKVVEDGPVSGRSPADMVRSERDEPDGPEGSVR